MLQIRDFYAFRSTHQGKKRFFDFANYQFFDREKPRKSSKIVKKNEKMKKLKKKRSFRRFATVERDFHFAIFVIFGSKFAKSKKSNFQNPDFRPF